MRRIEEVEFAVVDVETTGFNPEGHDRIIEIAILRVSPDGSTYDDYSSLINPGRDLGATNIHGITGRDVQQAPRFADIIGDVVDRLRNAVFTSHNVRFDSSFVRAECERAGCRMPRFPMLCTMSLASQLHSGLKQRRLVDCCEYLGIQTGKFHSAADDAQACGKVLQACLNYARRLGFDTLDKLGCQDFGPNEWPQIPRSGVGLCRSEAQRLQAAEPHYLARLVTRLMGTAAVADNSAPVPAYLALLDRALEDRRVSEEESEALFGLALQWGMSGEQVCVTHREYLISVAQAALADGVISEAERSDLIEVTRLLGFDKSTLDYVITKARSGAGSACANKVSDLAGKTVCFTGALQCTIDGAAISRSKAHELASQAGMIVAESVTRALEILVLADPHSLSSKAKKARQYGTRIIAEAAFWSAIGVVVD